MNTPPRPPIVCLCGSTRFKREYFEANFQESLAGRIVLTLSWRSPALGESYEPTPAEKVALDELHKRRIDLADEVLIIAPGGYIGDSTRSELAYAQAHGKPIRWWEVDPAPLPPPAVPLGPGA